MGKLVKALVEDYLVVTALNSKDIVETARKIHKTSAVATAALGRTLTMCAIMGKNMKNASDYLTVEIKGGGELGKITVCSDSLGNVKGYVDNPNAETHIKEDNHIDVARSVGKDGSITVIKNLGLKEPYLGTCRLVSGEIGEDFAQYFAVSEQQPCAIALGVLVEKGVCTSAGGIVVEVLPNCPEELLTKAELIANCMDNVSGDFLKMDCKEIIDKYFGKLKVVFTAQSECRFLCDCSRKRLTRVLVSLGKEESEEIIKELGKVEFTCHFCGKLYEFYEEDVERIFSK